MRKSPLTLHLTTCSGWSLQRKKGIYTLTVELDQTFLNDPETVYPVIVDPTVTASVSNAQSATAYLVGSTIANTNVIGMAPTFGKADAYIKTNSMGAYTYINTNNITSAYYRAYEDSGHTSTGYLEAYDTWFTTPANQVTYAMCADVVASYNWEGRFSFTSQNSTNLWIQIPITRLVQNWIDAKTNPGYGNTENYGFVLNFTNTASNTNKVLRPPGSSVNPPSIVINYTEDTSIPNGTYYIKNVMSGKYLDVENAQAHVSDTMVNVIVWPFNGGLNQAWQVESQGNGWYKIRSKYPFTNPQYLDNTSANADVYNDTSYDYLLFRIVQNLDGTYRIFNKDTANQTGALDMNNNPANTTDYQKNVLFCDFHGANNQRWVFEPLQYSATVNNYFDNGLLTRWGMTNTPETMSGTSGIKYWTNLAHDFYWQLFKLNLTFNTPTLFESTADSCCGHSDDTALKNFCTHLSSDADQHPLWHKDSSTIYNAFHSSHPYATKTIGVLWTGHYTNGRTGIVDEHGNIVYGDTNIGVSTHSTSGNLMSGGYTLMQNSGAGKDIRLPSEFISDNVRIKRTYLHELAHGFGAPDSYCAKDGPGNIEGTGCSRTTCAICYGSSNGYSADCIMSKMELEANEYSNGLNATNMSYWLCSKCKEDISNYLMHYYHQQH